MTRGTVELTCPNGLRTRRLRAPLADRSSGEHGGRPSPQRRFQGSACGEKEYRLRYPTIVLPLLPPVYDGDAYEMHRRSPPKMYSGYDAPKVGRIVVPIATKTMTTTGNLGVPIATTTMTTGNLTRSTVGEPEDTHGCGPIQRQRRTGALPPREREVGS